MLKRLLLIGLLLAFSILIVAQETALKDLKALENIITKRSQRLESQFSGLEIQRNAEFTKIEARYRGMTIREYRANDFSDLSIEKVISFFMNLEESFLINKILNTQNSNEIRRIEVIDALYEYPYIDDSGSNFIYISDKGTGNRNPFILNLASYQEKQVLIPETGDYFPLLINNQIYFLKSIENGFSIIAYNINNDEMVEMRRGEITCLRKDLESVYFSEERTIYKMNLEGRIVESFQFDHRIQSFDVQKNHLLISMLDGVQYDLFVYDREAESLHRLTQTDYNEIDVVFQDDQTALFSSNRTGHYGLYEKYISEIHHISQYTAIYEGKNEDIFYAHYSDFFSKIICSVYVAGKEPKLLFISH